MQTAVAPSDIAGNGTFASAPIAAGEAAPVDLTLVNHSCEPNLWWVGDSLVAAHDIAAGDELTYDYATDITDPHFVLRCHCPSYRCRQMVTGDDWRIPELQTRYDGHWSPRVAGRAAGTQ